MEPTTDEAIPIVAHLPSNLFADLPFTCIEQYFLTLNNGDFEATSALFAKDGVLFPPFEDGILGPRAIATYLKAEASGMQLNPRTAILHDLEDNPPLPGQKVEVKGTVKTPLFGVPVRWIFRVDAGDRICSVGIQLLASLGELLQLRPQAAQGKLGERQC
jgi:hypothetical protein